MDEILSLLYDIADGESDKLDLALYKLDEAAGGWVGTLVLDELHYIRECLANGEDIGYCISVLEMYDLEY